MPKKAETAVAASVASQIRIVRGQRVLLDSDLAALYGVTTKVFNQAVRRNIERFPADFLLQLCRRGIGKRLGRRVPLEQSLRDLIHTHVSALR